MQILNIDELASPRRQLKYKGKEYEVLDLSVQDYIDNLTAAEKLEGSSNPADGMKFSIEMITRSIPSLPIEEIRRFNPAQLGKVLEFIRGELDDKVVAAGKADATPGAEGAPDSKS